MEKKTFDFESFAKEVADALRAGKPMVGRDGVFTPLLKMLIEGALDGEMDAHLEDTRKSTKNRRNGRTQKTIQSPLGGFEVFSPRDRNSTFEPQIVEKRKHSISSDIDQQIIALYGRGMSYSDIQAHLIEIYGLAISDATLSAITDRIIPQIKEWQNRVLESIYPVVWMDAMHYKVRENGKVVTKAIYSVLGVNTEGQKEVLGVYFGDHESSSFWRQVLNELRMRGIEDIMVICIDNLKGFAQAIEDVFPRTDVQLCLVHQMRNSMKYMSENDTKPMVADLKKVYKSINEDQARHMLSLAEEKWGDKYKAIFRSWHNNWDRLTNFFKYPPALRRIIYTTNPIESYHRMVRKTTKTKGAFVSEDAIVKQIYLATINAQTKWAGTMYGWSTVRRDLEEYFGARINNPDTLN